MTGLLGRQPATEVTPQMADIIHDNATWYGGRPALMQDETCLTWAECEVRMTTWLQWLEQFGVERFDRVAVLARNRIDYVILQYALAEMGGVLVPINTRLHPAEIARIIEDCDPVVFMYEPEFGRDGLDLASVSGCRAVPLAPSDAGGGLWAVELIDADRRRARGIGRERSVDWDHPVAILYTGGTTGQAKGVVVGHRRNIVDGLSVIAAMGVRSHERFLCCGPLSHTAAWDYIKAYFLCGGGVVLMDRFEGSLSVRQIERWQCNGLWAVPLMLREMIEASEFSGADLSSLRLVAYSAYDPSELLGEILRAFRQQGAEDLLLAHGYGLSEAGPFVTVLRPGTDIDELHTVGTPVPGASVRILDEEGRPLPPGSIGEVCVRSAATMNGYWRNETATEEMFRGGWLHTGDLGRVTRSGHLVIEGRLKDMIRTAGENVYAKEVELAIVEHPAVLDCAVIGKRDERYDERVVAIVVPASAHSVKADDIRAFVGDRIASFKVPKEVLFVETLPKTAAGKTDKPALRDRYGDGVKLS